MITFGGNKIKLALDRREPNAYDLLYWDFNGLRYVIYKQHKLEIPYNVGFKYHIILYKKPVKVFKVPAFSEMFNACLINPLDYAEYMAGSQYYGIIGKFSDKSHAMFSSIYYEIQQKGFPDERFKSYFQQNIL